MKPRQPKVVTGIRAAGLGYNHSRRVAVATRVMSVRRFRELVKNMRRRAQVIAEGVRQ